MLVYNPQRSITPTQMLSYNILPMRSKAAFTHAETAYAEASDPAFILLGTTKISVVCRSCRVLIDAEAQLSNYQKNIVSVIVTPFPPLRSLTEEQGGWCVHEKSSLSSKTCSSVLRPTLRSTFQALYVWPFSNIASTSSSVRPAVSGNMKKIWMNAARLKAPNMK